MEKKTMTEEQAAAILAEYPDADLSAFDVRTSTGAEVDVDALAVETTARTIAKVETSAKNTGAPLVFCRTCGGAWCEDALPEGWATRDGKPTCSEACFRTFFAPASLLLALVLLLSAPASASCGDFVRGIPDHVLLARTCVSERGWRIETDDCAALYETAVENARRIALEHPGYEVRDAVCDLSPNLHSGEITRRRWLLDLEEDGHQPEGWTGARWTRRSGCGDDREGRCRVARREDWIATLDETRRLFTDGEPRVCERPPRAWGSDEDLRRRRLCGYAWLEIECGNTENRFGWLRAPREPICGEGARAR